MDRELAELRASAAGAVRVKDLEWKVDTDGIIYAQGVNIVYTIEDLGGDLFGLEAKSGEDSDSILTEDFDTLEAAKSAAQEFHAQQVLACLETGGE
ncbi:MAG TPA: hypothetical protein VLA12_19160 [Planctomycetaceae bacterium]|nr:hypothetical protein [Planctomycetaceae bacterium]